MVQIAISKKLSRGGSKILERNGQSPEEGDYSPHHKNSQSHSPKFWKREGEISVNSKRHFLSVFLSNVSKPTQGKGERGDSGTPLP